MSMPLFGKKNIPEPAFVYRPTRKEGYVLKNHLGQPFVRGARRRFVRSNGFHVEYFKAEGTGRRGRFDLRNVSFICASVDPDAGAQAIDMHIAVNGDAALTKMITWAFAEDDAKEVAALHALWCSAVAADNVDGSLATHRSAALARNFDEAHHAQAVLKTSFSNATRVLTPRAPPSELNGGTSDGAPSSAVVACMTPGGAAARCRRRPPPSPPRCAGCSPPSSACRRRRSRRSACSSACRRAAPTTAP